MSIWIAKFLGPIILALGIPMVVAPKDLLNTSKQFLSDSPLVLISGVLAMTAGLAIVNTHNVWILDWPIIITLFGWALVVGGSIRVIAPRLVDRVGGAMMKLDSMTRVAGVFWIILGLFLTYKGYL